MSEQDQSHRPTEKSEADRTLLGVAPPRVESSVESLPRAPVYVRAGTALADAAADPPARPALLDGQLSAVAGASQAPSALPAPGVGFGAVGTRLLRLGRQRPVLWMVLTPALLACLALSIAGRAQPRSGVAAVSSVPPKPLASESSAGGGPAPSVSIAELEAKPTQSLSARELLLLSDARSARVLAAANALRRKVETDPALAKDAAIQNELLAFAADERTARAALAGMAALDGPLAADLLYETWTRNAQRSDVTELARALLYSGDVRAKASPGLAVALDLRLAESCQQYQAVLPSALKDGDRRSLHLLTKLNARRGCGPKKAADCFACLREHGEELNATINAVKSRHAPSYGVEQ